MKKEYILIFFLSVLGFAQNNDTVFTFPEEQALWRGCENELDKSAALECTNKEIASFLSHNLGYPGLAKANKIEGTVYLEFIIDRFGSVTNVKVLKGIDEGLEKEAIRVVLLLPRFIPAKQDGKPVQSYHTLSVNFTLPKESNNVQELHISKTYSQKLGYFQVNYENRPDLINWGKHEENQIYYRLDSTSNTNLLKLKIKPKYFPIWHRLSPFLIDTSTYFYYPNWNVFSWITPIDATLLGERKKVCQLNSKFKLQLNGAKELFRLLIAFRIINVYNHLPAELTITDISNLKSKIDISYHCKYKICTSKCFDPEYDFKLVYDKLTNEVYYHPL